MSIIVNIFLCATFFIMVAGFSTYIFEQLGINKTIVSIILSIVTYNIFLKNIDSITKINGIIIPILIITIIVIGVKNTNNILVNKMFFTNGVAWIIEAILYASYNIILLIPVLVNLKKYIKNKKQIINIAVLTGIVIFIISTSTFLLFINLKQNVKNIEMPIVYIIQTKFEEFKIIYGIVILIAIFTTEVSAGISFLNNICKDKKSYPQIALYLCIASIIISKISFSKLVNILFPIFGYLGLIQIYFILKSK